MYLIIKNNYKKWLVTSQEYITNNGTTLVYTRRGGGDV